MRETEFPGDKVRRVHHGSIGPWHKGTYGLCEEIGRMSRHTRQMDTEWNQNMNEMTLRSVLWTSVIVSRESRLKRTVNDFVVSLVRSSRFPYRGRGACVVPKKYAMSTLFHSNYNVSCTEHRKVRADGGVGWNIVLCLEYIYIYIAQEKKIPGSIHTSSDDNGSMSS